MKPAAPVPHVTHPRIVPRARSAPGRLLEFVLGLCLGWIVTAGALVGRVARRRPRTYLRSLVADSTGGAALRERPRTETWAPHFGMRRHRGFVGHERMRLQDFSLTAAPEDGTGPGGWQAIIVVEGVRTLDHREIAPGALTWRDLPLPLMGTAETTWGHEGATIAGTIIAIDRVNNQLVASGTFDSGEAGVEFARLVGEQTLRWVSVDLEIISSEYVEIIVGGNEGYYDPEWDIWIEDSGDYDWWERILEARVMGATVCPFPAFPQCVIVPEGMEFPATTPDNGLPTLASLAASGVEVPRTAAGYPETPPAAWFADPHLDRPTHLTVTDEGRVFGHLACWGVEHTGFPGQGVTAPTSPSGYRFFRTGVTYSLDADGQSVSVPTGPITLGTGHAGRGLQHRAAAEHYDNTGTAVADVAAGEDAHGIWIAGALRPGVSTAQVRVLRASDVSGDWRTVGGDLELVAALVVNCPGFPIPIVASAAGDECMGPDGAQVLVFDGSARAGFVAGEQVSLVAAGLLRADPSFEAVRRLTERVGILERVASSLRPLAIRELAQRIVSPTFTSRCSNCNAFLPEGETGKCAKCSTADEDD